MRIKVASLLGRCGVIFGLFALLAGVFLLAGCQTETESFAELPPVPPAPAAISSTGAAPAAGTPATANPAPGSPTRTPQDSPEFIKVGDILTVTYYDIPQPPSPTAVKVREDGTITLLYNLSFVAAGKTSGDLEREIRARYVPSHYVNMTVTVFTQNSFYFVDGEVRSPNRYPYTGKTTILKAIASAGDFTDYARRGRVQLTRAGRIILIDCGKALKDPTLDLEVYPNDKIHVPRRPF